MGINTLFGGVALIAVTLHARTIDPRSVTQAPRADGVNLKGGFGRDRIRNAVTIVRPRGADGLSPSSTVIRAVDSAGHSSRPKPHSCGNPSILSH